MDKDNSGALPAGRATHEPSPTVSAVPVGIPSAEEIQTDREMVLLALYDAKLQLKYLDSRWPTVSTPTIISRIERALNNALPWPYLAQAIEARSAETERLGPKGESAVPKGDAHNQPNAGPHHFSI